MNIGKAQDYAAKVAEFQTAFESPKDIELWTKLVNEETDEVLKAAQELLKETCDLVYVMVGLANLEPDPNKDIAIPPELGHKLSFALEYVQMMVEILPAGGFEDAFTRVHLSNMSKLGEDGKPIRREDGKVLKGPNYAPPVLEDLIY